MNQQTPSSGLPARRTLPVGAKAVILIVVILAALFAAYAAFCAWVGDSKLPPHTYVTIPGVAEPVDVGDTDANAAAGALAMAAQVDESRNVTVTCGDQATVVTADVFAVDENALVEQILSQSGQSGFLSRGVRYLADRDREAATYELSYDYRTDDRETVERQLSNLSLVVEVPAVDPTWTVGEDSVEVVTGIPGSAVDLDAAMDALLAAFQAGETTLTLEAQPVEPAPLTAEQLNEQIYVEPVPLGVDENGDPTAPVVGISIDTQSAQALLDAAEPGTAVSIPLVRTQPDYSEAGDNGLLYQDLLSECKTYISGSSGRLSNVELAAEKCSGVVLLPGDTFSYNDVVGKRTTEAGFKSAPAYYMGQTVNEIGGGICQVSSSLYYCAVYANLDIVTRYNHRYAVGYVPDGLDATVSWGGPEFKFKNDTDYPIKIVAFTEGRNLTVQFYGTNPDGIYVQTERTRLSTTNYTTVYQADESIPVGTTKESVTPYTGRKVQVYRCVYSADGTLLSRTLENVSNYSHRDRVILDNPADAASLGLAPESPSPSPIPSASTAPESASPSPSPSESAGPETSAPAESTTPVESASPAGSSDPTASVPPAESPAPSQSAPADAGPVPGVTPTEGDADPVPTD